MLRSKEVLSLTGEPRSQFPNVAQRERLENIDLGVTDTTMQNCNNFSFVIIWNFFEFKTRFTPIGLYLSPIKHSCVHRPEKYTSVTMMLLLKVCEQYLMTRILCKGKTNLDTFGKHTIVAVPPLFRVTRILGGISP